MILRKAPQTKCFSKKIWRRHPDLNRGIKVLQTFALPLGYDAINIKLKKFGADFSMERETRLEPATFTLAR